VMTQFGLFLLACFVLTVFAAYRSSRNTFKSSWIQRKYRSNSILVWRSPEEIIGIEIVEFTFPDIWKTLFCFNVEQMNHESINTEVLDSFERSGVITPFSKLLGYKEKVSSYLMSQLICQMYPDASSGLLVLLSEMSIFLIVYDDYVLESNSTTQADIYRHIQSFSGSNKVAKDCWDRILMKMRDDLVRLTDSESFRETIASLLLDDWVFTLEETKSARKVKKEKPIQECMENRLHSSFMIPYSLLSCADLSLPKDLSSIRKDLKSSVTLNKHLRSMLTLCAEIYYLINDAFSLAREIHKDDARANIIYLHSISNRCSLHESLRFYVDKVQVLITLFDRSAAALEKEFDDYPDVSRIAARIRSVLYGTCNWHSSNARYSKFVLISDKKILRCTVKP